MASYQSWLMMAILVAIVSFSGMKSGVGARHLMQATSVTLPPFPTQGNVPPLPQLPLPKPTMPNIPSFPIPTTIPITFPFFSPPPSTTTTTTTP
ncbi:hypothetical protein HN51_030603 [Arachis hypogaea]|uniref:Uncharacterized protein n=1 Tax=Arachis hypogaea TaxID=3818 RepID=A0A445BAN5_ARAHY|nr:proline-rich receptor-like protein kinase PERK2 [Arachis hypogaea]RYR35727.1 hypothetical protein Ahy_A10g050850 [Arachis hypogaea]